MPRTTKGYSRQLGGQLGDNSANATYSQCRKLGHIGQQGHTDRSANGVQTAKKRGPAILSAREASPRPTCIVQRCPQLPLTALPSRGDLGIEQCSRRRELCKARVKNGSDRGNFFGSGRTADDMDVWHRIDHARLVTLTEPRGETRRRRGRNRACGEGTKVPLPLAPPRAIIAGCSRASWAAVRRAWS